MEVNDVINDLDSLKEYREKLDRITKELKNKEWGFDKPWEHFITAVSLLSAQSYGARIQNRIIKENEFTKIAASEEKGDYLKNGQGVEFKASIINEANKYLNMVQIRLWQNVSYHCVAFDIRGQNFKTYNFNLTHDQMEQEISTMNACAAHGTSSANDSNEKVEYRVGLVVDPEDKHFKRWTEKYLTHYDYGQTNLKREQTLIGCAEQRELLFDVIQEEPSSPQQKL